MATNESLRLAQVSADHHRWLKTEAARRGVSMVELLAEVIQAWISGAQGRGLMDSDGRNPFLTLLEDGK